MPRSKKIVKEDNLKKEIKDNVIKEKSVSKKLPKEDISLENPVQEEPIQENVNQETQKDVSQATVTPTKNTKKIKKSGLIRLADFLFILSIIGLILTGLIAFSFLGFILYYLILIVALLATLFILYPTLKPWIDGGNPLSEFMLFGYQIMPYILLVGGVSGIAALVIYITQKDYAFRKSRIITTSIFLALYLLAVVLRFVVFGNPV